MMLRFAIASAAIATAGLVLVTLSEPCACDSRRDTVQLQLKGLQQSLELFRLRQGRWPRKLLELKAEQLLPSRVQDPWGQDIVYVPPAGTSDRYCLFSSGPDRLEDTMDDILANCDLERLNKRRVLKAARHEDDRLADVYGRPIRLIRTKASLIAWSYGPDGLPDTADDHTAVRTEGSR